MLLSKLLRPELIRIPLDAEERLEAVSELVDVLVQAHEIPYSKRDDIVEALREHEHQLSSGMRDGIAVPHIETDKVDDLLCAMGISKEGVPFHSRDDRPAYFVVLLLAPSRGYSLEIETLRDIAKTLHHESTREAIRNAPDALAVLDILRNAEAALH